MYMPPEILPDFYRSKTGRIVRRIIKRAVMQLWDDCAGRDVLGLGYAHPYIGGLSPTATALCLHDCVPEHHSPAVKRNMLAMGENTAARIFMIHDLEFCQGVPLYLARLERILSDDGRLLMVVPARKSGWSHTEWSPFGYGAPFTRAHIMRYINDHSPFTATRFARTLYMPPTQNTLVLRGAGAFEFAGKYAGGLCPAMGGVHIIEAVKTKYAGTPLRDKPPKHSASTWGALTPAPSSPRI